MNTKKQIEKKGLKGGQLKNFGIGFGIFVLCLIVALAIYLLIIQPRNVHWGLEKEDANRYYFGDELFPDPFYTATHAVTIDAPVEEVWPWLVQLGQDRGGFYSYKWLENLFGYQMKNADQINPQWQTLGVGDIIKLTTDNGMKVIALEKNKYIVCDMFKDRTTMWAFYLETLGKGKMRLIARCHLRDENLSGFESFVFDPGHFIMERKMLLGIKYRAERAIGIESGFVSKEWIWGITFLLLALAVPVLLFFHHRPWNGITAGIAAFVCVVGLFCSYASILMAVVFLITGLLAFLIPVQLERKGEKAQE